MKRDSTRSGTPASITNCDVKAQGGKLVLSDMRPLIYDIRGVQVMLDRDLAAAYQVTTAAFNQAVKRNANRFPETFRFQLTKDEHEVLISQIVTSKRKLGEETRGGYHKLPFAFTEQGIAMLSGVLRSDVAVSVSGCFPQPRWGRRRYRAFLIRFTRPRLKRRLTSDRRVEDRQTPR